MANGRKLDAKDKVNQAKNLQKPKDQHVPSKRHVQDEKNMIQRKIKRPQRLKIKSAKIMWVPKLLNEAMYLNKKFKMASNFANPKASFIHKFSKLPFSKSILGPYVPQSTIPNPSSLSSIFSPYIQKFNLSPTYPPRLRPFHHPSRCVSILIFPPPSSTHSPVFQPSIHQPCLPPNHSTPLI